MVTTPLHSIAEALHRLADELVGHADAIILNKFTVGNPEEAAAPAAGAVNPEPSPVGDNPEQLGGAGEPLATPAPDTPIGDTADPLPEEEPPPPDA